MSDKTVVVLGVGPADGVGGALARRFAKEGRHVIVAGRTQEKLEDTVSAVTSAGGSAEYKICDVTSESAQDELFSQAESRGLPIDSVIFNAGNNHPIPFADLSPQEFENYWRVGCLAGFITAKRILPTLVDQGEGSLLITGASASLRGRPNFAHFAASKSALRTLAQALAREFGPQGVHVAHIIIDGVINGDNVRGRFGGYLDQLGEDGSLAPDAIADAFWMVHDQPRNAWTHELDLRPFKETW